MPLPAVVVAAAKKAARKATRRAAARTVAADRRRRRRVIAVAAGVGLAPVAVVSVVVLAMFGVGPPATAASGCPAGAAVPASAPLPPATVEAINALKPLYDQVAASSGLAWSVLAAVDYREDNNDPQRSALSGEPIGSPNPDSGVVTTSKLDSLQRAAGSLRGLASSVYGVTLTAASTGADLQLAFLAYNRGSLYRSAGVGPEESPYVVNQLDEAHVDMAWPAVAGEVLAGRVEYGRLGAYTVFQRLGGAANWPCGGGVSGSAAELLVDPHVVLSAVQRADLEAGLVDPRVVGALSWLARDHTVVVSALRSDHSVCAGGSGAETASGCAEGLSAHADGRAMDIAAVDGQAVSATSTAARAVVDAIVAAGDQLGLAELGQPFYDATAGRLVLFSAGHGDHIHLGVPA